jgi:amidase
VTELHDLSALEQAEAVRRREVSPVDLVEHYLERIARHNDELGAFVTVAADAARERAGEAERAVLAGDELPPLHGVPTAIKDLNLTAGIRTTFGSRLFADFVPPIDDYVVDKLRQAGTISLGKTNTPEFGLSCYSENDVAPPARLPWDTALSPGGSSGGAAAAVAAGLASLAQGSDGGGSIRTPSSLCGLVGIKVSRGRVSNGPVGGDITGLAWNGPIARTVADAAALLDAMAGPMPGDPHWAPPLRPGETFLGHASRPISSLRIGRFAVPPVPDAVVDPECRAAWEDASTLLADAGHDVEDIEPPLPPDLIPMFEVLWTVATHGIPIDPDRQSELTPLTRWLRERGGAVSGAGYVQALGALQAASRRAIIATAGYDAVLCPTVAMRARPIGWFTETGDPAEDFERQKRFTPFTAIYNITGQPSISVPLHTSSDGLPVGVMLSGRPAQETTLISLAAQLEAMQPWRDRHPATW